MARRDDIVVGLDIGTTKICMIVGEVNQDGVDIIGLGTHPSKGLRKGVVINIDSTVESIKQAIEEAELMAGCEINSAYCGIAGGHIKSINSHGIVAVKDREVTQGDVDRVIDAAQAVAIPMDREVLHTIPQEFVVDDQDGIRDPIGMCGVRLEAKVHIVTGAVTSAQNIIKCANRTGLNVNDIALEQIASSEATLCADEKELGVALVDIGGGTTDIAIFSGGSLVHTSVLTIGGNHLTNDIAVGLRTPMAEAEKIKIKYGCALSTLVDKEEMIEVPSVGGRPSRLLSRHILTEIIEPRVEEIYTLILQEVTKSGYRDLLASGIVITGGCSIMEGMSDLGEQIFDMPVRVGVPQGFGGLVDVVSSPIYSTAVGLVLHGAKESNQRKFKIREDNLYYKVKSRMREWFSEIL